MSQVVSPTAPPTTESESMSAPDVESDLHLYHNQRTASSARCLGLVFDSQNLLTSAIKLGFWGVNYARMARDIAQNRPWLAIACIARPKSGAPIDRFVSHLRREGIRDAVWESPRAGGCPKVDLDPLFIAEAAHLAYTGPISELCVVAHDGDYRVLEKACKWRGIPFVVAGLRGHIARVLRACADGVIELGPEYLVRGTVNAE